MTVEIRCPDCDSAWQVAEPKGGEMLCPTCMTRIPLDGFTTSGGRCEPEAAADPEPVGRPAPDPVPRTPSAPLTGGEPPVLDPVPTGPEPVAAVAAPPLPSPAARTPTRPPVEFAPVVCPRCNLHFDPWRSQRTDEERKTVLVVDDLAYFRQIATDALEPTFDVTTAATSAEARDLLLKGGIDLLVLDLTLDGCNAGRDLLARLIPKPCPILIFTAKDESEMYGESWEELQRLGADDLVIKGMKVSESLKRKVSALLGVGGAEREDGLG